MHTLTVNCKHLHHSVRGGICNFCLFMQQADWCLTEEFTMGNKGFAMIIYSITVKQITAIYLLIDPPRLNGLLDMNSKLLK